MKIVQYGEWEIAVDVEKTKEYYKNYISKKTGSPFLYSG